MLINIIFEFLTCWLSVEFLYEFIIKNNEFINNLKHKSILSNEQIEYLKKKNRLDENITKDQNEEPPKLKP